MRLRTEPTAVSVQAAGTFYNAGHDDFSAGKPADWSFFLLQITGLYNTRSGLTLTYLVYALPLTVLLLRGYFRNLPAELEEAAYIDGAGPLTVFWKILLPLSAPGLFTTTMLTFIGAWNEFLFALTF